MKLSIIIPVYNTEKYLTSCLTSLINQDLATSDYEIIVVNDGSTDASEEIILKYKNQYSNLVYIKQENQGVSVARNKGLDVAKGEYVLFVDSDDSLFPNVLGTLYQNAKTNQLDLLYLQVDYFDEKGVHTGTFQMEVTDGLILDGFHHQRRGFIFSLYREELIREIRFIEDIPIAEDSLFNIIVHSVAQRCSYISLPAYKYLIRSGSALNSNVRYSHKTFQGYIKLIDVLAKYVDENKNRFTKEQLKYFERPFYKYTEMALLSNIIPNLSVVRYSVLRKKIKEYKLTYLDTKIKETVPLYATHWSVFITYYGLKKILSNFNSQNNGI